MRFEECCAAAHPIDGMLSDFSIAVMDMLLVFQSEQNVAGHVVELGVYKGRSAAVLAVHTLPSERLVLVDIFDQFQRERFASLGKQVEFYCGNTEDLWSLVPAVEELRGSCRIVHIDASHQFVATLKELAIADQLIDEKGVVILDDFVNLDYSQNIAAIFKYLFTENTELTPFLVTGEKAYLCKRDSFDLYGGMILHAANDAMRSRGMNTCIARTDITPEYRAFHLRGRSNENELLMGYDIYKGYYVAP